MRVGTPDIICCYKGRFLAIEVKSEKGTLTKYQKEIGKEIQEKKGYFCIARNVKDISQFLKELNLS